MYPFRKLVAGRTVRAAMCVAVVMSGAAASAETPGRIDFDAADLPPASVEVNLGPAILGDLLGLGDAAIAGVAESLMQSAGADSERRGTREAAEQLAATRQIVQLAKELVHEVRVRVYAGGADRSEVVPRFDKQLRAGEWDTVVRVRDGDNAARVSLLRSDGAVHGAFIVAGEGSELVLVNVVCDVSPENVKKLTSTAAKIGLENGLDRLIEQRMQHLHRHSGHRGHPPETSGNPES